MGQHADLVITNFHCELNIQSRHRPPPNLRPGGAHAGKSGSERPYMPYCRCRPKRATQKRKSPMQLKGPMKMKGSMRKRGPQKRKSPMQLKRPMKVKGPTEAKWPTEVNFKQGEGHFCSFCSRTYPLLFHFQNDGATCMNTLVLPPDPVSILSNSMLLELKGAKKGVGKG